MNQRIVTEPGHPVNLKDIFWTQHNKGQKAVVFIVGKKNPATQNLFIPFFIENLIANINSYAFSWPNLNFGCYLTFEMIFKSLFQWKND